jgi:hypothetical protein
MTLKEMKSGLPEIFQSYDVGVLEYWSDGMLPRDIRFLAITPILQHSIFPYRFTSTGFGKGFMN